MAFDCSSSCSLIFYYFSHLFNTKSDDANMESSEDDDDQYDYQDKETSHKGIIDSERQETGRGFYCKLLVLYGIVRRERMKVVTKESIFGEAMTETIRNWKTMTD